MAFMETTLGWFNIIEKRLWGSKTNSNRYFATAMLQFMFFGGAVLGSRELLQEIAGSYLEINGTSLAALWTYIAGILICESICISENTETAVIRSLTVTTTALAASTVGYFLSIAGLIMTAAWCIIAQAAIIRYFRR